MPVETRYMRSDQQTINGLLAYVLGTTQSTSPSTVKTSAGSVALAATLYPTSDILAGFPNQIPASGNHYDKVDDPAGTPDDATTMVCTSDEDANTYYDRYGHTAYAGSDKIACVRVVMRGLKASILKARGVLRGGIYIGTTYYTFANLSTGAWKTDNTTWFLNPATNLPWTVADINNLQLAIYGSSKLYLDAYFPVYCTQIYLEVYTYTEVTITYAIDVAKRASNGTETSIGTKVASGSALLSVLYNNPGLYSKTWSCPLTDLDPTDSIVVRVYQRVGVGAWSLVREFTTGQLGADSLDSATWTVYYYLSVSSDVTNIYSEFSHGSSACNSRIANFSWTSGVARPKQILGDSLASVIA